MDGVAGRLANRVQLTTDGYRPYLIAVEEAFEGGGVDYGQLVKFYGNSKEAESRYSPGVCTGSERRPMLGNPDKKFISTSYVERQNLTIRMSSRRFTRLTNAFSKKAENLAYAVALHFQYYNFARPHILDADGHRRGASLEAHSRLGHRRNRRVARRCRDGKSSHKLKLTHYRNLRPAP